jgi:hypothetical protein
MMIFMSVLRFKESDAPGQRDAEKERKRELDSVVGMKGYLRQQIRQRNAKENAGGKGQSAADGGVLLAECSR